DRPFLAGANCPIVIGYWPTSRKPQEVEELRGRPEASYKEQEITGSGTLRVRPSLWCCIVAFATLCSGDEHDEAHILGPFQRPLIGSMIFNDRASIGPDLPTVF